MRQKGSKLTARYCETVNKPGRHGDGRGGYGLALNVKPMSNGRLSKSWTQRLRIDGKPTNIGLGKYPFVTLAEARVKAVENAKMIHAGHDPRAGGMPTFERAADEVIKLLSKDWRGKGDGKSEQQWRSSLRDYIFPKFGNKRIDRVTSDDVLSCVAAIWYEKPTTAKRVRQRIGRIMAWAVAKNYRTDNPARSEVTAALPKQRAKKQHFASLHYSDVPAALSAIRESKAAQAVKLAFELLILTAARSGDVRGATWSEIDLDTATWTIPGARMKAGEAHIQPLSGRAVDVLREARELSDGSGLVFSRENGAGIANYVFPKLCKALELGCTAHGFRTSFRVWATERSRMTEAAIEQQLAHKVANEAKAAYDQSERLTERREGMALWAQYLTRTSADVVRLSA